MATRVFLGVACALLLVGIGMALWRPGRVIGAGGDELGSSLARKVEGDGGKCRETTSTRYACFVEMEVGSGARKSFRLVSGGRGCWKAFRIGYDKPQGGGHPVAILSDHSITGCVSALDYVLPRDNTQVQDLGY